MEYYWINGLAEGRPLRAGPYDHDKFGYEKAQADGIQFCGSNFEILTLHTRDKSAAKQEIQYVLAHRGMPLRQATQKQIIKKPELEASSAYKEIRTREINGEL